jgi:hypothetical protein
MGLACEENAASLSAGFKDYDTFASRVLRAGSLTGRDMAMNYPALSGEVGFHLMTVYKQISCHIF